MFKILTLFPCQGNEYAHIRADGRMCRNSNSGEGVPIGEGSALFAYELAFKNSGVSSTDPSSLISYGTR